MNIIIDINGIKYTVTELYRHRNGNYPGHYTNVTKERLKTISAVDAKFNEGRNDMFSKNQDNINDENEDLIITIKGDKLK